MNFIKNKKLVVVLLLAVLAGSLLVSPPAKADNGYNKGLQHLFPYYVPETENERGDLSEITSISISGDNNAQKARNFAKRQLLLNDMSSAVFGSALYDVSELDPEYNDQNSCGIAAWECDSERWQRLLNFSEIFYMDSLDLKTQLLFINFELNGLGVTEGTQGEYQDVYNSLKNSNDFNVLTGAFMQSYLNRTPSNLSSLSQNLYNYTPTLEYNEDDRPAEPEPEPEPNPRPVTPPPRPEPEITPISEEISPSDCRAGLADGYIAVPHAGDQNGRYLSSLSIISISNSSKTTSTLVHRCLKDSLQKMLSAYNSQASSSNKAGGWGWRSQARQIELREANCGSNNYDIWEKPASQCSPPTARPGYSSHQDGLAIDFYCNKQLLNKSNCGEFFDWLDCNAAQYGLINLPSEAWHWFYPVTKNYRLAEKIQEGC